jgi:hypothetical protein
MKNHLQNRAARLFPSAAKIRAVAATLILLVLASCASQVSREAEIAAVEAERVAIEQEAVQLAAVKARARAAELQLQRDREAAERARVEEARVRQVAEARARADAERERRAVVAAAEAERQDRLDSFGTTNSLNRDRSRRRRVESYYVDASCRGRGRTLDDIGGRAVQVREYR